MKKLITIILLLIPIVGIKAETYYSPYGEEQIVEGTIKVDDDLTSVSTEKKYLFYDLKKNGDYFIKGEQPEDYVLETNFWKYSEWSEWSSENLDENENREIEQRSTYFYKSMKPITKIKISMIAPLELSFQNILIYKGTKKIEFQMSKSESDIYFELREPCYIDELEIVFTLVELTNEEKHFQIEFLYENDEIALEVYSRYWFLGAYNTSYQYRNMNVVKILYEEPIESSLAIESNFHRQVWTEEQYRHRDKLFYYEKEQKIYSDDYLKEATDLFPYKDKDSEVIITKIRRREKLMIDDLIVLKNKEDLNKFIFSTVPYQLTSNIDWSKNGIYQIIITTDFGTFIKDIYLDLIEKQSNLNSYQNEYEVCMNNNKNLESELDIAKATIVSLSNETSNKIEKDKISNIANDKEISVRKQNLFPGILLMLLFTVVGIITGRIMTMKKNL